MSQTPDKNYYQGSRFIYIYFVFSPVLQRKITMPSSQFLSAHRGRQGQEKEWEGGEEISLARK